MLRSTTLETATLGESKLVSANKEINSIYRYFRVLDHTVIRGIELVVFVDETNPDGKSVVFLSDGRRGLYEWLTTSLETHVEMFIRWPKHLGICGYLPVAA